MKEATFSEAQVQQLKTVTTGILLEFTDSFLLPRIDDLICARFDEKFAEKIGPINNRLNGMDKRFDAIDKRFGEVTYELKSYVDDKLANQTADIFKRMDQKFDQRYDKDSKFKHKVVQVFKVNKLCSKQDLTYLAGAA